MLCYIHLWYIYFILIYCVDEKKLEVQESTQLRSNNKCTQTGHHYVSIFMFCFKLSAFGINGIFAI